MSNSKSKRYKLTVINGKIYWEENKSTSSSLRSDLENSNISLDNSPLLLDLNNPVDVEIFFSLVVPEEYEQPKDFQERVANFIEEIGRLMDDGLTLETAFDTAALIKYFKFTNEQDKEIFLYNLRHVFQ